uniref:ER membrane protein complex subunit 10 n=1 Tax=Thelazia callipaeda TaxID=103827 RepID=A0A0N5CPQ2_THECL
LLTRSINFAGTTDFTSLGNIIVERTFDNNYTAHFQATINPSKWRQDLIEAAENGWIYRVRADKNNEYVQSFNEPCLMLKVNGAHHFRLLLDSARQELQSLTVFPENLFSVGPNYHICETESFEDINKIRGSVAVDTIKELPLPDTISYIQKMEKERQSRQHGAQQDKRSFIQKYWMYIVAAIVFMVISNAAAGEQSGE